MNATRILAVASREWREIIRDRLFFTLAFMVSPALMLLFNFGLTLDVENIPLAVVDYDGTPRSRDYISRFTDSRFFDFRGMLPDEKGVPELLASGAARAVIIVPERFGERLAEGRPVAVQTLLDGIYPFRAQTIKGYVASINQLYNAALITEWFGRTQGLRPEDAAAYIQPVRYEIRFLYNQSLVSDWSLAPKFIMVILVIFPPMLTALGVVREKETGAILNIRSSTVTRGEYLTGKLAPYLGIAWINALALWIASMAVFGAPFKGSALCFLCGTALYVLTTAGIGLMISTVARTQVAAIMVTFVATVLPAILYSGVFIPVDSLTGGGQVLARLMPTMYYTRIIVGSFLKGVGFGVLWRDMAVLAGYDLALFALGYAFFRKRVRA